MTFFKLTLESTVHVIVYQSNQIPTADDVYHDLGWYALYRLTNVCDYIARNKNAHLHACRISVSVICRLHPEKPTVAAKLYTREQIKSPFHKDRFVRSIP